MPRPKGSPNKITSIIKDKLADILSEAIDSLDIKEMNKAERLKLIQIGIQYVIPRLKQIEEINDEMPTNFQIEIIDRLGKYKDRDLDKAITGQDSLTTKGLITQLNIPINKVMNKDNKKTPNASASTKIIDAPNQPN